MICGKSFITSLAVICVILQACHAHELTQVGVKGSFASVPESVADSPKSNVLQNGSASALQYLTPSSSPRRITVITRNGTRLSFFTTASAMSALIPLEPAASFNPPVNRTPETAPQITLRYPLASTSDEKDLRAAISALTEPVSATVDSVRQAAANTLTANSVISPAVSNSADSKATQTQTYQLPGVEDIGIQFNLLYRPRMPLKQTQEPATVTHNKTPETQLISYSTYDTPPQPTLQGIKYISPYEITTALPPSQQSLDAVKALTQETLKNPKLIWKYLKYRFKSRRTTTEQPLDGSAVLAAPKFSTPATVWKKPVYHIKVSPSKYDADSVTEIPLSGDHKFSYRACECADKSDSSEEFIT